MTSPVPPFGRPCVVISQCLELAPVRYDGALIRAPIVRRLADYADLLPVCPEVGIRLGVPRDPIRLVRQGDVVRLRQPSSGRDLTDVMDAFSREFLAGVGPVDGFILKSRSPSCGIGDVKLHAGLDDEVVVATTSGRFAAAVLERFGGVATDEVGLGDAERRHHWLTRVFTRGTLREAVESGRVDALQEFHIAHRLLLAAHNPAAAAHLGRLLEKAGGHFSDVARAYAAGVDRALRRAPSSSRRSTLLETWTRQLGEDAPEVRRCRQPYPEALTSDAVV